MAFGHGKLAVIKMDNASGALFDLTAISNAIDLPKSLGTGETTSFGQNDKTYIAGLMDGTVSIGGSYDNALDATIQAAVDAVANNTLASLTVEYGPQGTATGKPKYTLEVIPTNYNISTAVAGVGTFKLDCQRTGPTVRSTY